MNHHLPRIAQWRNEALAVESRCRPQTLSQSQVDRIFAQVEGVPKLIFALMYFCGLTLKECLRIRGTDIDVVQTLLVIRDPRYRPTRKVQIPAHLVEPLARQVSACLSCWHQDKRSYGDGLDEGSLFYGEGVQAHPVTSKLQRNGFDERSVRQAFAKAVLKAGVPAISCHSLRHSFAVHQLEQGLPLCELQHRLGHQQLAMTRLYQTLPER